MKTIKGSKKQKNRMRQLDVRDYTDEIFDVNVKGHGHGLPMDKSCLIMEVGTKSLFD
jgi:hypothetical protein